MKHPCKGCPAKVTNGRIICPLLHYEIALEGCNRMYGKTPKQALDYITTHAHLGGKKNLPRIKKASPEERMERRRKESEIIGNLDLK